MEDATVPPRIEQVPSPPQLPEATQVEGQLSPEELRRRRQIVIGVSLGAVFVLAVLVIAIYALTLPSTDTAKIRDIFIIVMALESLIIGLSLIILMIQLAQLISLLRNEIKPILESTQDTVNTLQGTTRFLTDNMVERLFVIVSRNGRPVRCFNSWSKVDSSSQANANCICP